MDIKIAGAHTHYNDILKLVSKYRKEIDANFLVYDMFNNCAWNGGRQNADIILSEKLIQTYNNYNIKISLGFTNQFFFNKNDEICINLINKLKENNAFGDVIIRNDKMHRYLKKHFGGEYTFSITGHPLTDHIDHLLYYKELESKYDYIVPKYTHLNKLTELFKNKQLDPSKYEILLNDNCTSLCKTHEKHFTMSSIFNIIKAYSPKNFKNISNDIFYYSEEDECVDEDIKYKQLKELYSLGVRRYKICGRDQNSDLFISSATKSLNMLIKVEQECK